MSKTNRFKPKSYKKKKPVNDINPLDELNEKLKDPSTYENSESFDQLPLSEPTLKGLTSAHYIQMSDIQKSTLPLSLCGRDILGAAKTGSGKTLAFAVPLLEKLYREQWTSLDGLGALVISPTRELAFQIFQVLTKIGKFHSFSAGLLIGGKDLKSEQERIHKMNILVTTPGRLLQHMDQTADFNCDTLKFFVLDEADRILDSGFEKTINAIIENLPKHRQTLLFSATQTKSVKDLARLSLKNPEYIAIHEKSTEATPSLLTQKYLISPLAQKLDILYSFIKTHLKTKIIIFLSSCKQVKFVHDTFCKMQPGIQLMCLHGKQKQSKRMTIFDEFCRKKHVCLFSTDIAARGLDFPAVDWVIQLDCPDDVDTYIHRVGRTARYESSGNALLFLLPSEEPMLSLLEKKKIPITMTQVNPDKIKISVSKMLQALCFQDPEIKYLGQKAFTSYVRSIYLQKNKDVFKIDEMPMEEFAESLGLSMTPKIKYIARQKNDPFSTPVVEEADEETNKSNEKQVITKIDKMFARKNNSVLSSHYQNMLPNEDIHVEEEDEDEFMKIKRKDHTLEEDILPEHKKPILVTKVQLKRAKEKELKKRGKGMKIIYDEDGNEITTFKLESVDEFASRIRSTVLSDDENAHINPILREAEKHGEKEAVKMKNIDLLDKQVEKSRLKDRKHDRKLKEKERKKEESQGIEVTLDGDENEDFNSGDEEFYADDINNSDISDFHEDLDYESEASIGDKRRSKESKKSQKKTKIRQKLDGLEIENLEALAMNII